MKSDIKKIVNDYLEIFPDEKENLKKLQDLLVHNKDNYENLFNRKNMEGHITASGYIYSREDNKLLLLEHKALNKFLQPGGHSELSDNTILDTAKREIKEETGLENLENVNIAIDENVPIDINTHFIPANPKKNEGDHYHNDFRYLFIVQKASDVKIDETESNGYKWVPVDEIRNKDNFKNVIKKILNLVNSRYYIKEYYKDIINKFNINLKDYNAIVISHFIPDCLEYLEAVNNVSKILKLIPKPNSIDNNILQILEKKYDVLHTTRDKISSDQNLINAIKNSDKPIIVFDIGAYFAEFVEKNREVSSKIKFIIEDTENGHQKYEKLNTDIKILSVARSPLKEFEDYLVGESVLFSADGLLRTMGEILEYKNCGVIGYGKIGESICRHLLQRGVKPYLYDIDPIKEIKAYNNSNNISSKEFILKNCDAIFLATGNHSLDINDFRKVKNGTYIFSVTSSDDEIGNTDLKDEYEETVEKTHIYKYKNSNNYFYLIERGNAVNFINNAVMGDFIYIVKSEMLVAMQKLSENAIQENEKLTENLIQNNKKIDEKMLQEDEKVVKNSSEFSNEILELDEDSRKEIARIWLEDFNK